MGLVLAAHEWHASSAMRLVSALSVATLLLVSLAPHYVVRDGDPLTLWPRRPRDAPVLLGASDDAALELMEQGQYLVKHGKFAEAAGVFSHAVAWGRGQGDAQEFTAHALYWRATALAQLKDAPAAVAVLEEARREYAAEGGRGSDLLIVLARVRQGCVFFFANVAHERRRDQFEGAGLTGQGEVSGLFLGSVRNAFTGCLQYISVLGLLGTGLDRLGQLRCHSMAWLRTQLLAQVH